MLRISTCVLLFYFTIFTVFNVIRSEDDKYNLLKEKWCGDDNCYTLLQIKPDANRTVIKQAYTNLSLALHPDKNPNQTDSDKQRYLKITHAYEILSSSTTRTQYDEYLRLKSSWDSPRERPIFVFLLLYVAIVFIVLQYQKQRYNLVRKAILDDKSVQRYFLENKKIDLSKKKEKKLKKTKSQKKKNKPTSSSSSEENEEENEKSEYDLITDEDINVALQELKLTFVEWNHEKPTWAKAAVDVPMFILWCIKQSIFQIRWYFQYKILKKPISRDDAEYLCRKFYDKTEQEWESMEEKTKEELLRSKGPWRKVFVENESAKKQDKID